MGSIDPGGGIEFDLGSLDSNGSNSYTLWQGFLTLYMVARILYIEGSIH